MTDRQTDINVCLYRRETSLRICTGASLDPPGLPDVSSTATRIRSQHEGVLNAVVEVSLDAGLRLVFGQG
jgi:hypothetical protein